MLNDSYFAIVLHDNNEEVLNDILDICSKVGLNTFNCNKLEIFSYMVNNFKPKYVIFANTLISTEHIETFANSNPDTHIFVYTNKIFSAKNIFMSNSLDDLHIILKHYYNYYSYNQNFMVDKARIEKLIFSELNTLCFSVKTIGTRYLTDLVFEVYTTCPDLHFKCSEIYNKIAGRYNTTSSSIERTIRFSIIKAYQHSKNKQLFYNISQDTKIPTIKEVVNYILNYICFNIKNSPA